MSNKYLENYSPNRIREIILGDYPNFKIEKIKIDDDGWDNIVADIGNKYIFRFPKADNDCSFETEVKVLNFLKYKISLQIPKIDYLGRKYKYMGYRKIQGVPLTPIIINRLSPKDYKILVSDLATFLLQFHSGITLRRANFLGIKKEDYRSYYKLIESRLYVKIKDAATIKFIKNTVSEYKGIIRAIEKEVVLYNDLHGDNVAFDKKRNRLNGIFDFSDVLVGDVNLDFNCLYRFGSNFLEDVVDSYQRMSNSRLNLRSIIVYAWINELSDLAKFIDKPNSNVYRIVKNKMRTWQKEKNMYI